MAGPADFHESDRADKEVVWATEMGGERKKEREEREKGEIKKREELATTEWLRERQRRRATGGSPRTREGREKQRLRGI